MPEPEKNRNHTMSISKYHALISKPNVSVLKDLFTNEHPYIIILISKIYMLITKKHPP